MNLSVAGGAQVQTGAVWINPDALAAQRAAEGRSHLVDPGAPPFLLGSSTGAAALQARLWQHRVGIG